MHNFPSIRMLAVLLSMLLLPNLCLAEGYAADVDFPVVGKVHVEAYSSLREPGSYPYLLLKQSNGIESRFKFLMGKEYSSEVLKEYRFPVRIKIVSVKGITTPLIVGVAGMQGGSDSTFETMIVGAVNDKLIDLLPDHPVTNIEDAVCVGLLGKNSLPQVLVAKFIWGSDEAHPEPHYYYVTNYSWSGSLFDMKSKRKTRSKHSTGLQALAEFGYDCREDITETLAPDVR